MAFLPLLIFFVHLGWANQGAEPPGRRNIPREADRAVRDITIVSERDLAVEPEPPSDKFPGQGEDSQELVSLLPISDPLLVPEGQTPLGLAEARPLGWDRTRGFLGEVRETVKEAGVIPPQSTSVWNHLFDGVKDAWRLYGLGPDITHDSQIPAKLRKIAAPFRTEVQLQKLMEKPKAADERFSYIWISDLERGRYPWSRLYSREADMDEKLLQEIKKHSVDFVVLGGDIVSRGTVSNYYSFFTKLQAAGLQVPVFFVMGNHDDGNPHGGGKSLLFRSLIGEPNYAFDLAGVRFVVADSSSGRIDKTDLRRLRDRLSAAPRSFVFTHMPAAVMRRWTVVFRPFKGAGGFKYGAQEFTRLMTRFSVETVFHGHIHAFARQFYHNVLYVLSGGGGSPLYPSKIKDKFYHFIRVDVSPEGHQQTVYRWDEDLKRTIPTDPVFVKARSKPGATAGPIERP